MEAYRLPPTLRAPLNADDFSESMVGDCLDFGPPLTRHASVRAPTWGLFEVAQISPASPFGLVLAVEAPRMCIVRYPLSDLEPTVVNTRAMTLKHLPTSSDTSTELIQVGSLGRRAVWLEHNLDTRQKRVMKMSYDPSTDRLETGVLFPANGPALPFSPTTCHCMAFDEVTGRLCMGLYDGNLYMMDFV